MKQFEDTVAAITGAASGIGRGLTTSGGPGRGVSA